MSNPVEEEGLVLTGREAWAAEEETGVKITLGMEKMVAAVKMDLHSFSLGLMEFREAKHLQLLCPMVLQSEV